MEGFQAQSSAPVELGCITVRARGYIHQPEALSTPETDGGAVR